jgi:hypothetical protein
MKQLELLEQELLMMQENIERIKNYKKEYENQKWQPCHSNVVGELKHRIIALKQRLTLVSSITTNRLFENE